ncbi:hypothetical protein KP509_01G117000 [Ceratopteris richardii]|uniref:Reticulon domain-containing protein n=1 Tax=Ceratopteris richardii TaxID=49495 RepID=A0A8T2VQB1_CERRI|nr:hypothetical protein KP509_01G117000 [Ceratopteris richardii]
MSSCGELNLSRVGMGTVLLICGTLVYYHCAIRTYPLISLAADVLIVLLSSLCVLGLLFRFCNISVPVDPLEWEVSQETANRFAACIANVVGATESVLRVAAKGEDKKLFLKVAVSLYFLSALGRVTSGATIAYLALCSALILFCMSKLASVGRVN